MTNKVYTWNDIEKLFNEKVAELMAEGRVMNLKTMRGMYTNELGHVDFKDGDKVLRVWLVEGKEDEVKTLELMVKRYSDTFSMWPHEGEEVYTARFYVLNKYWYGVDDEDAVFTMNFEEAENARLTHRNRAFASFVSSECIKNKDRLVKLVRRHKGYGKIKAEDISMITKGEANGRTRYEIRFGVKKADIIVRA